MKQVLLKITGKQYTEENATDDEPIEFVTEGRLYEEDGTTFLEYDETELSGMAGCTTRVAASPDRVSMTRSGSSVALDTKMEFETGKRFTALYHTEVGPIEMELLTYSIANSLTPDGGTVLIDYHVALKGLGELRHLLEIEVLPGPEDGEPVLN